MSKKIAVLIISMVGANFAASAQFTNRGATIVGRGDVIVSSSLDIDNSGDLQLQGSLNLQGKRKVTSEKVIVVDNLQLSDVTNVSADVVVNQKLDFGSAGLVKMAEENQLTFGSDASYTNFNHGKGVMGKVQKVNSQDFVFPLGTESQAFPTKLMEKQGLVEASIKTEKSTDLGDFNYHNLESPSLAVIELKSKELMQANHIKLAFDDQKEEVVLNNNVWVEANRAKPSTNLIATKALAYNRATALQSAEGRWVNVYPNPSRGDIDIYIDSQAGNQEVNFRVLDLKGAVLLQERKAGKDLEGKYNLPSRLGSDSYLLEFESADGKRTVLKHVINR